MNDKTQIIMIICLIVTLLTLRIKQTDNGVTIQFGILQLIKDCLNKY